MKELMVLGSWVRRSTTSASHMGASTRQDQPGWTGHTALGGTPSASLSHLPCLPLNLLLLRSVKLTPF